MASPIRPRPAASTRPSAGDGSDPEVRHRDEDLAAGARRVGRGRAAQVDGSYLDELRPLPPEPLGDRIRRSFLERSRGRSGSGPAGLDGWLGVRSTGRPADGGGGVVPGPLGIDGGGARQRSWGARVAAVLVVVVVIAVSWWLLRPPAAPVESSIPAAGGPSGAVAGAAGGGGEGGFAAPAAEPGTGDLAGGGTAVGGESIAPTSSTDPGQLVVHASGAVASPGVYRLPAGARVDDLVRAAGGLTADGDGDRVNLAALLTDGERIWVPRRGEVEVPAVVAGGSPGAPAASGPGGSGATGSAGGAAGQPLIDLNTATAVELETLPGVGPATASAILAHRDLNGPFRSVDDLIDVRGIGEAKLEQIRPLVRT